MENRMKIKTVGYNDLEDDIKWNAKAWKGTYKEFVRKKFALDII